MKSIFNKANAPYLVSGALATSALLASGVFTVAPYIGFLASVAALSVGLPLIVVSAVFSVVAIALSCAAISKNNTIAEKNKVIDQKTQDIKKVTSEQKDQLSQKNTEILKLKEQLSDKEAEVKAYKQKIPEKNNQTTRTEEEVSIQAASGKALTSTKEAFISDGVNRTVKDAYSSMSSADSVRNWIPSLKTVGYIAGVVGLMSVATYAATNGLVATYTSPNAVNPIAKDLRNHTLSLNSHHIPVSLQITMENKTNEYSKKLDDALESAKNNFGIPKDHSEPQWFKDLYKSETTEEIIDNGTLSNLFSDTYRPSDYQPKSNITDAIPTKNSTNSRKCNSQSFT